MIVRFAKTGEEPSNEEVKVIDLALLKGFFKDNVEFFWVVTIKKLPLI